MSAINPDSTTNKWSRLLVIIPAKNEEATVGQVVRLTRTTLPRATILVVDDGSTDNTEPEARAAGALVLRHTFSLGYGAALHTGYKFAGRKGFKFVVQLDADGQHEPRDLPKLLIPLTTGRADVALGSRFLSGERPSLSLGRRLGILFFGSLASLGLKRRLTDPTSGFQAISAKALKVLANDTFPDDYPDADVLLHLSRNNCRIEEVPVRMYSRNSGRSMHSGFRTIYYVFKMSLSLALTPLRRKTG